MQTGPVMISPDPDQAASAPAPEPPPPLPALVASPIRFCRTCGAAWEAAWEQCLHCNSAQGAPDHAAQATQAQANYVRDLRFVKTSVFLYFSLLAVSVITMIAVMASRGSLTATAEFVATAFFSGIVVVF